MDDDCASAAEEEEKEEEEEDDEEEEEEEEEEAGRLLNTLMAAVSWVLSAILAASHACRSARVSSERATSAVVSPPAGLLLVRSARS